MPAASAKRTVLVAVSVVVLAAVAIAGPAGGASSGKQDRVPPTPPENLHVTDATPRTVSLAWDPSQDNVAVSGYYVYGDKGRSTAAGTSYIVTNLNCGESTAVAVSAYDSSGNRSPKVWTTVATAACPDLQPPTAPSGFVQSATTQTGVVLGWSPSTDDVGVVEYAVYSGVTRVDTISEPTVALGGLSCGSTYLYGVDAVDAAGNRSPISTTFVRTASCGDGEPPSQPTGLAVISRTTDILSLAWAPSTDNVGVAGYRVSVDGSPTTTVSQPGATIGGLACGTEYTVAVDAFDAAGNRSPATSIVSGTDACASQNTVDTTPPSTPKGLAVSNVTQSGLTLSWTASTDDVGVTGYDVSRNGVEVETVSSTSSSQTGLACGTAYSFSVVARDAAGNASNAAQVVTSTSACSASSPPADTTPPSQPSNLAITGATATSVTLGWGASSDDVGVAGYRSYVNGAARSTTSQTSTTVGSLTCGTSYTFEVDAYDAAGNRSTRAAVIGSTSACVDTQPPSTPTNLVSTSKTATSIALSWTASSDNVAVAGYGLYRGATLVGTSGTTSGIFSGLACNTSYTLAVDAYDAAGNRSQKVTTLVSTAACPDTTPPSAPTGLAASNVTQTGLTLMWNASSDNVGVTGYDVYRGGTKMETVTTTSSSQSGLACGTSYTFGVAAVDAAGNRSGESAMTTSTSPCSTTAPPSLGSTMYEDTVWDGTPGNVDPRSDELIGFWLTYAVVNPNLSNSTYGVATAVSSDSDKTYAVNTGSRTTRLDTSIRIPANAQPASGSDGHLAVYDPVARRVHDLYQASYNPSTDTWSAGGGQSASMLDDGLLFGANFWGSNAAKFPLMAGLIRPEEIAAGHIPHALVFGNPKIGYGSPRFPAVTNVPTAPSTDSRYLVEGTWLQLDPAVDLRSLGLKPWEVVIARAMQEFGMFLRDNSGSLAVYAEDTRNRGGAKAWEDVGVPASAPTFSASFPWGRMRVLSAPSP